MPVNSCEIATTYFNENSGFLQFMHKLVNEDRWQSDIIIDIIKSKFVFNKYAESFQNNLLPPTNK